MESGSIRAHDLENGVENGATLIYTSLSAWLLFDATCRPGEHPAVHTHRNKWLWGPIRSPYRSSSPRPRSQTAGRCHNFPTWSNPTFYGTGCREGRRTWWPRARLWLPFDTNRKEGARSQLQQQKKENKRKSQQNTFVHPMKSIQL